MPTPSLRLCRNCNEELATSDQFCSHCGASVGSSGRGQGGDDGTRYYNPIQTPGRAKLTMILGTGELFDYNLGSMRHIVGRKNGEILFPNDEYLNDEHAAFTYTREGITITDYDTLNGTYLRRPECILRDKPVHIIVGKQFFRIELVKLNSAEMYGADGSLYFISPVENYKFRVVHVLAGGCDGSSTCSPTNNVVIGRQGCDFTIDYDPFLSPHHVQIREEANGDIVIRDLSSKNGTFFRIDDSVALKDGDYIQMGKEIIRVEINQ